MRSLRLLSCLAIGTRIVRLQSGIVVLQNRAMRCLSLIWVCCMLEGKVFRKITHKLFCGIARRLSKGMQLPRITWVRSITMDRVLKETMQRRWLGFVKQQIRETQRLKATWIL